ncbi:hypothetical protein B296_00043495 [Ensete ventricosum]|uniref:Uncharacterized protein n=1 Tax=Ensete ventricosum TaxID=4639 RepID=A0A426YL69_ENSVE|nr:hypothetical protein B296_00043495 [Ensete ventricosum]
MYFIQVELLAKKYEEKYKQVGEIASKLAIEEAKYRDIQVYTSRYVKQDIESKVFCLFLWYSILDFYLSIARFAIPNGTTHIRRSEMFAAGEPRNSVVVKENLARRQLLHSGLLLVAFSSFEATRKRGLRDETDYEGSTRNAFMSHFDSIKADSPSASSVFEKGKKSLFFEDSVPSSPLFNSASPSRFNDGRDGYGGFSSFSRFDSFATQDSGPFPAHETFSRFDSIGSSRPEMLARFDSVSSSREFGRGRGFESFDDADPFGTTGPLKPSGGGHAPKQGSDNWRAF